MGWLPPGLQIDDNYRYLQLTYNGVNTTTLDKGLIMSGNTPLSHKIAKRSTMDIPYMNGTIDTSCQHGTLLFNERELTYTFASYIPRYADDDLDDVNTRCDTQVEAIKYWMEHSDDGQLYDSGAGTYFDCKPLSIKVDKSFSQDFWILAFELRFKVRAYMQPRFSDYPDKADIITELDRFGEEYFTGRSFYMTGKDAYEDYGLYISNKTPLVQPEIKYLEHEMPYVDGTYNLGHYYGDTVLEYDAYFFLDNWGSRNTMNAKCQAAVEKVVDWLYSAGQDSWQGVTMAGTTVLNDSTLGTFHCARCTGIDVNKVIFDPLWVISYKIQFTTYPRI